LLLDGFAPPVQPYQGVPPAWDGNPASEWYLVDKNYQPGGQYNYPGPGQGPWQGAAPVSGVFPGAFPSETYYSGLPQIPVSGDINGFAPQSVPNGPWYKEVFLRQKYKMMLWKPPNVITGQCYQPLTVIKF